MCQLCKFSPNRENTVCHCYRITLHGRTRIYPGKDQKVCQGFSLSSSHFHWQKQTDSLRFQFGGKKIVSTFSFKKIYFETSSNMFHFHYSVTFLTLNTFLSPPNKVTGKDLDFQNR
jgi:hypothetical protein